MSAQFLCCLAAFWVALFRFPARGSTARFAVGLLLGAVLTRVGWAVMHGEFAGVAGSTVLFVPLGPLVVALGRPREGAARFVGDALASLPLALAVARLGCGFAGCCGGLPGHPVVLYEVTGWLLLEAVLRNTSPRARAALFLLGFGGVRLAISSFRVEPDFGTPWIAPEWVAAAWVAAGALATARLRSPRWRWRRRPVHP